MEQPPQEEDRTAQAQGTDNICKECNEKPWKYKCPGCYVRTCSLPCVKSHKRRTGCSGKRSQTHFVPLSQFDDNLLLSDYNLLEEMKRAAESARRTRAKLCPYFHFRLPNYLDGLRRAAASRRTRLLCLPAGMSKREKNQSRYNQRKKCISWTIEWRFHSTDVVLLDHGVHEDTKLCYVIEKHLKPGPWNHWLRQFSDEHLDSLKFFIRKNDKGPKSPFCELDIRAPLRQQLANLVILEYPVIHVFLPSQSYDFEVVKDVHPVGQRVKNENSMKDNHLSQKGIAFREEEIQEENGTSDPQVHDFMNNGTSSLVQQVSYYKTSDKALRVPSGGPSLKIEPTGSSSRCSSKSKEPAIPKGMKFDYDQGLMEAYSDIIAEINSDDFLDLGDELFTKEGGEGKYDLDSTDLYLLENELEEGEILE